MMRFVSSIHNIHHDQFIQLSHHLNQRLMYGKGERDMILMRHEVTIRSGSLIK